jgi:putative adenylate-forming enzyme
MSARVGILASWLDTRLALRLDECELRRRRERLWRRMAPTLAATPALAEHAGRPLHLVPITDAADMRDDVSKWNSAGIGHEAATLAALDAEAGRPSALEGGVAAGLSTGTTGRRGLFLATEAERAIQIGQSIARLLPGSAILKGARIALVLRADSALYGDVRQGRFEFLHLPLGLDALEMRRRLEEFAPTVLIAPPRELSALARSGGRLPASVQRVFWGSEPIAPMARASLSRAFGMRIDPIYQATEGFIGASCRFGSLHLNEDSMEIELEPVPGTDAFRPIVTDLKRTTQPMVRVRLDDLVRPAKTPCACGSARHVIEPVLGRVQDIWRFGGRAITPEAVDDYFTAILPERAAWRVLGSPTGVVARIAEDAHRHAMADAIRYIHPDASIVLERLDDADGSKRRRVAWEDGHG